MFIKCLRKEVKFVPSFYKFKYRNYFHNYVAAAAALYLLATVALHLL